MDTKLEDKYKALVAAHEELNKVSNERIALLYQMRENDAVTITQLDSRLRAAQTIIRHLQDELQESINKFEKVIIQNML